MQNSTQTPKPSGILIWRQFKKIETLKIVAIQIQTGASSVTFLEAAALKTENKGLRHDLLVRQDLEDVYADIRQVNIHLNLHKKKMLRNYTFSVFTGSNWYSTVAHTDSPILFQWRRQGYKTTNYFVLD